MFYLKKPQEWTSFTFSRACNDDGLLLKPSKPITAIDSQIYAKALGSEYGPEGEVWSTYTMISDIPFGIIFAADMKSSYNMTTNNIGIPYWVIDDSNLKYLNT